MFHVKQGFRHKESLFVSRETFGARFPVSCRIELGQLQASGRFTAIPGRRGTRTLGSPSLVNEYTVRCMSFSPMEKERSELSFNPSNSAARMPLSRSSSEGLPFKSTRRPCVFNSGTASSSHIAKELTARMTTASKNPGRSHASSSLLIPRTSTLEGKPKASTNPCTAAAFFLTESRRVKCESHTIANGIPGKPPPVPISKISPCTPASSGSTASESSTWVQMASSYPSTRVRLSCLFFSNRSSRCRSINSFSLVPASTPIQERAASSAALSMSPYFTAAPI